MEDGKNIKGMEQETPGYDPWGVAKDNAVKALPGIMAKVAEDCPAKGKRVKVIKGQKHNGKEGIVFWHGRDKFVNPFKYSSGLFQGALTEARGTWGYRVGIRTDSGEKFFVKADNV